MPIATVVLKPGKSTHLFLSFILLFTFLPTTSIYSAQLPIQSALLQQIQSHPDTNVNLIIQKTGNNEAVDQLVTQLGGKITKNLRIINSIAVELPATYVEQVAAHRGVRWVSLDAPVEETGCKQCIATQNLKNVYNQAVLADKVWNTAPYLQGKGITVAVVDSGINKDHPDLKDRVVAEKNFRLYSRPEDYFGHGTFVAGVIAGDGNASKGAYVGIAPKAQLVNVKVSGALGESLESDVIEGLQWIYEQQKKLKIRVVNISLNSSIEQSYHTSPLAAACEILWFNGMVVVTSAGNQGSDKLYPPANDPFVITVGATDDMGTTTISDDTIPAFSAFGVTKDGVSKPDLVAPGRFMVGAFTSNRSLLSLLHRSNVIDRNYFKMSGTSVSAPVVTGAVALLLQDEPTLTPDQVKYRLMNSANRNWAAYTPQQAGAGYLDIEAAIHGDSKQSANTGIPISNLLTTGPESILLPGLNRGGTAWDSVSWSSVSWSSVSWSSVSWSSVSWSSDYWEDGKNGSIEDLLKTELLNVNVLELLDDPDHQGEDTSGTKSIFLPLVTSN